MGWSKCLAQWSRSQVAEANPRSWSVSKANLSLVRPDDGWFPGLEAIRSDLEMNFTRLRSSHTSLGLPSAAVSSKQSDCDQLQNSFGNV